MPELERLDRAADAGRTFEGYVDLIRAVVEEADRPAAERIISERDSVPNVGGAIEDLVRPRDRGRHPR